MKSNNPIQQSAKTAGLAYLLIILTSILSMIFGPYKLMVEGDTFATMQNIAANPLLFRAGTAYDLLMFIGVIILSVALYQVLKTVNQSTALTALLSRFGEALGGTLTVACSVLILWLINREDAASKNQEIVEFLFEVKAAIMNLVFAFLGFGTLLYCALFYRSRYIPRWLAGFGILAFFLVFAESILVVLFNVESTPLTGIPAIVFEITIGIWLLVKGVDLKYMNSLTKSK
jgi:hypothetical protein